MDCDLISACKNTFIVCPSFHRHGQCATNSASCNGRVHLESWRQLLKVKVEATWIVVLIHCLIALHHEHVLYASLPVRKLLGRVKLYGTKPRIEELQLILKRECRLLGGKQQGILLLFEELLALREVFWVHLLQPVHHGSNVVVFCFRKKVNVPVDDDVLGQLLV